MNPLDELSRLAALFPEDEPLFADAEYVPKSQVPEPYQSMLVHEHHMTITMEQYHDSPVEVRVLDRRSEGDIYSRKIILVKAGTEEVVQFGFVRFDFQYVTDAVREEITSEEIPLGRVLINHNVLRHIDVGAILKITAGPELARILQMEEGGVTYGRLATIFCNGRPAVDLFEVAAPLEGEQPARCDQIRPTRSDGPQ